VHPNILGSLLNVTIAMTVPQLFAKRPFLPRWLLVGMLGIMGVCLGLTISRGSMFGLAVGIFVISALRYRKLLPWMGLALVLALLLPWTQEYVGHFIEGALGQDLSTQMRLGVQGCVHPHWALSVVGGWLCGRTGY
jgi:O-antigen ligase